MSLTARGTSVWRVSVDGGEKAAAAAVPPGGEKAAAERCATTVPPAPAAKRRAGADNDSDYSGGEDSTDGNQSWVVNFSKMALLRDGKLLHRLSENTVEIIKGLFPDTSSVDVYFTDGSPYPRHVL